jgi:hypothetical protein
MTRNYDSIKKIEVFELIGLKTGVLVARRALMSLVLGISQTLVLWLASKTQKEASNSTNLNSFSFQPFHLLSISTTFPPIMPPIVPSLTKVTVLTR